MGFEFRILDFIQSIRTPIGDTIMPLITKLGDAGAIWILLAVILFIIPRTRKSGAILVLALLADLILCNVILKNLFERIRPCDVNTSIQLLISRPHDFSFPSGHTAASFASVTALMLSGKRNFKKGVSIYKKKLEVSRNHPENMLLCREKSAIERNMWKPALLLAVLIAFSRLYLYVHYPTDVLGGMVVGIVSGFIGYFLVTSYFD